MATRTLKVRIKNISNTKYTFYIGATISEGVGGSQCGLYATGNYKDLSVKSVTLDPYEYATIEWTFDDSFSSKDILYAIVKVWDGHPSYGGKCLTGDYASFERYKPPAPSYSAYLTYVGIIEQGYDWVRAKFEAKIDNDSSETLTVKAVVYVDDKYYTTYSTSWSPYYEGYWDKRFYIYKSEVGPGTHTLTVKLYVNGALVDTDSTTFSFY